MLVISSELLSALVIQGLNHRMSFMFISIHRHLNTSLFSCFFAKKLQTLDFQDIAVGAAYQFSGVCEAALSLP